VWSGDQRRHVTSRSKSRPGYLRLNGWTMEQYRANCRNGTDTAFHRTYSCSFCDQLQAGMGLLGNCGYDKRPAIKYTTMTCLNRTGVAQYRNVCRINSFKWTAGAEGRLYYTTLHVARAVTSCLHGLGKCHLSGLAWFNWSVPRSVSTTFQRHLPYYLYDST